MAAWAASGEAMVTKPNPRGRPLSRSIGTLASMTVPCAAKSRSSSLWLIVWARLPTNSFALFIISSASGVLEPDEKRVKQNRRGHRPPTHFDPTERLAAGAELFRADCVVTG